jgi:hypothetical protein
VDIALDIIASHRPKPTPKQRQYDYFTNHMEWVADQREQTWIRDHPEEAREQEAEWHDKLE